MAKRGSGLRTAIKVVKAIDRVHKQAGKDAERRRKQQEREEAKQQREYEKMLRQQEREQVGIEKAKAAAEKVRFKQDLENAKYAFEERCIKRQELRNNFVDQELR